MRSILFSICCLALATGCVSKPEPSTPAPDPALVADLWSKAQAAQAAGHLLRPAQTSAVHFLQQLRTLDPNHTDAQRTLESIAEEFINQAQRFAQQRQFNQGWLALDRARRTDPQHPSIAPTERLLQLQENAKPQRQTLSAAEVTQRSANASRRLRTLGADAKSQSCRVIITAANDLDGRWIYRQLQESPNPATGTGRARIRAQINIGRPAAVELLCL